MMPASENRSQYPIKDILRPSRERFTFLSGDRLTRRTGETTKLSEHVGHEGEAPSSESASPSSGKAGEEKEGEASGSSQQLRVSSVKHISKAAAHPASPTARKGAPASPAGLTSSRRVRGWGSNASSIDSPAVASTCRFPSSHPLYEHRTRFVLAGKTRKWKGSLSRVPISSAPSRASAYGKCRRNRANQVTDGRRQFYENLFKRNLRWSGAMRGFSSAGHDASANPSDEGERVHNVLYLQVWVSFLN